MERDVKTTSVTVLSAAAGAGHIRAADALVTAFKGRDISACHGEVLQHTNSVFRKAYSDLYLDLINRRPELLGWVYNTLDQPWKFQKRRLALNRLTDISDTRHPMKVIGFTDEMHNWMAASDILIGKAGGLTGSEALASGLVMVIANPVPGQEERNSDHFLEEGVAIRCNNFPALAYKIDKLLSDRTRLSGMKSSVKKLAHPNAASDIVSIVESVA